ncbi:glycoside hydrolase family 127 protein [Mucilaginibacter sp. L3T2-6]|uniref:glycoside hydrolase family 127 protein n=1 Tax=Mucilaginibacter sp. L3T2-6 TaxID=3062491 RepID=UPI0026754517|nr:glycoside hydrolase family 127 protein [Mucilaginibacter sp. L3T2-6]MDO3642413.1 glycoside hydrolase family 127 protein [Mucilaginibacter sp. L3T2-6]MDV6214908.1 glycoside hydrolase family 127 protein [Mucilaginibacter sp. L3T2-6]
MKVINRFKLNICFAACLAMAGMVKAQSYVPEYNDARLKIKPTVPIKAYSFDLKDVKLLDGPFKTAMNADITYLLTIEPDRLLSAFRTHSGLKAKGKMYEGWESSGLAGHTLGHYLSAISMYYASSRDPEFLKRVNYIVKELDECQAARKTGYVGAIPKEDTVWAEVAKGDIRSHGFDLNGAWSPWYTVHKVMAGLLDAYLYTKNYEALKVCRGMADWTGKTLKNLNEEQLQKMLICEYGGMAEVLANLYAITGDKKYLALSYKFYDKRILDPLAKKQDVLPGKHSNTQIPKIIASARRYELTGDKNDDAIANFFWTTVTKHHSYATGGNSNYEYLGEPDKLNDKLTENTTETCNTYNMLKLTRHLFAVSPSASLMDYYEKALYNHILASQNHQTGMVCYFVPLRMGGKKQYSTQFDDFTCCVGSGMENHVKYNESIYFRGADGSVYVNLFIPSALNYAAKGVTIKQESLFPASEHVKFTINTKKPVTMAIRLRDPKWAGAVSITINRIPQHVKPDAKGYFVLNRKWSNNDKIEFTLPENLYTEAMPDNADRRAVFYGPVLLAGVLGNTEPDPTKGVPVFVTSEKDPNKWLEMVDQRQLTFKTVNVARPDEVTLMPFNQTKDQYYSVYWDVFTPEKWTVQQLAYDAARKKQKELEDRTTDVLRPGEMQPERDHNLTGEKLTNGEEHTRKWRATDPEGYIQYDMKVDGKAQNTLINTYWGMDNRGRVFDILVDGIELSTEDLNKYKESRFYDISYTIPIELTKGKQKVTIKLQPKKGNMAGPVYGSRVVKE